MFDFGFSEMVVVAVVGLIVLGPERLPKVAKQAGQWLGKLQRYVADVKSEDYDTIRSLDCRNGAGSSGAIAAVADAIPNSDSQACPLPP